MNRRQLLQAGLAAPLLLSGTARAQAPVFIGDMHFHSFFADSKYHSRPVAATFAAGAATLVAWSIVADLLWIKPSPRGIDQTSVPKVGEPLGWFEREIARVKAHIAEQGLKIVREPGDVDQALKGVPHVVLAVEGSNFIEDDPGRVKLAYDLGVRHLQLVHYTRNTIGDFQTEKPELGGLTELGTKVVRECNRLGILIDLAHLTPDATATALSLSKVPVVWSHGSVTRSATPHWSMVAWRARQLTLAGAQAIANKGGVVGLWAFAPDVGRTVEAYAQRMTEMAGWLGENHVAFGTDINGLGTHALLSTYAEVRRVVETWQRQRVGEPRVRKLAIENYARVLKQALAARQG